MSSKTSSRINWTQLGLELIVVVGGILIALGIDSWAAERQNFELEVAFLQQLHDDLTRAARARWPATRRRRWPLPPFSARRSMGPSRSDRCGSSASSSDPAYASPGRTLRSASCRRVSICTPSGVRKISSTLRFLA